MRKIKFETGEYYHIYNRGVDRRTVFSDKTDYIRFLKSMREFNDSIPTGSLYTKYRQGKLNPLRGHRGLLEDLTLNPLVDIICYCLIPNHYHFLIRQLVDNGVSKFMLKLGNGYTQFFNNKHSRSGSLFQGTFKAIEIKSGRQLLYLSAYINGNPEIHKIAKADEWQWSSYQDYLGLRNGTLCNKDIILKEYKDIDEYKEYIRKAVKYSREVKDDIKLYLLENA